MENILVSIKPKWLELILSGQKTVELRKSAPLKPVNKIYWHKSGFEGVHAVSNWVYFGENILPAHCSKDELELLSLSSCVSITDIKNYAGNRKLQIWHIANTDSISIPIPDDGPVPQSWRYINIIK